MLFRPVQHGFRQPSAGGRRANRAPRIWGGQRRLQPASRLSRCRRAASSSPWKPPRCRSGARSPQTRPVGFSGRRLSVRSTALHQSSRRAGGMIQSTWSGTQAEVWDPLPRPWRPARNWQPASEILGRPPIPPSAHSPTTPPNSNSTSTASNFCSPTAARNRFIPTGASTGTACATSHFEMIPSGASGWVRCARERRH